jgi:small GTP-binding protein
MEKLPDESLFKPILKNYITDVEGVLGVAVYDRNGLIISSQFREKIGEDAESVLGAVSAVLDSYIDRIKSEFNTKSNFFNITSTTDKKFIFCSMGTHSILTTVAEPSTSDIELRVYSEHIAGKIELFLDGKIGISSEIPEIIKALAKTKGGTLSQMEGEYSHKLILTGDYQVGKTSLIRRFVENEFQEDYISTIGVQISKKTVDLNDKTKMQFIIWDIGGQIKQMQPYRKNFYAGTNAAFIVIDRARSNHLKSIDFWYNDIKDCVPQNIPIVIVGNKSDLIDEIVISEEEIKEISKKYGFHYILTSAKTGMAVNDAFLYIAYRVIETL